MELNEPNPNPNMLEEIQVYCSCKRLQEEELTPSQDNYSECGLSLWLESNLKGALSDTPLADLHHNNASHLQPLD